MCALPSEKAKVLHTIMPDFNSLYDVAERQGGYFTADQAREVGFSWERLSDLTKNKKFVRISPGIYRLVHFPNTPFEDLYIAYLRTGPDSVISHESALALYNLSDVLPADVHVIVPRTASRRRPGLRLHTHKLQEDDVSMRDGLPVTTVDRTIADLIMSGLADEQVKMAVNEALRKGQVTIKQLTNQGARRGGKIDRTIRRILQERQV
jgi:predicted transcriptional regulator of viral defense system